MKKIFVLGTIALFIACGNPQKTAETTGPDPNTDTMSTHQPAASQAQTTPPVSADNSKTTTVPAENKPADKTAAASPKVEPKAETAKPKTETGNAAAIKKGEALYLSGLDCKICHQLKVKIVGPAYADVAKKYENTPANVSYLVGKIQKGGSGVWGDIPMAPHPSLSEEDAKALVQYVLSVK